MFFGEESSGYVFTHTFFLKDAQSRGFQRWSVHMSYKVMHVMDNIIFLKKMCLFSCKVLYM